ncbi:MAG: cardiolipin synthase ClsB [Methylophilaceae bacterium]|nr:cardiolipin synthase ClsB [Methylophilaceae bacterium]
MSLFTKGNFITLLRNGEEYFPALEAAIQKAQHEIYIETYIYQADAIGLRIGEALMNAAARGVAVYLLLDGFGSQDLAKSYILKLTASGVQVMIYREKISPWTLQKNRLRRLHRKMVVVDRKIGFVGGINIIDDYDVPKGATPRLDYAVKVEGAVAKSIYHSVHKLWRRMAWLQLRSSPKQIADEHFKQHAHPKHAGIKAALMLRDNILHRRDIEEAYLSAISAAKHEIIIANAYFLPGWRFRKALIEAAERGVKVTLLLQGRLEYFYMFASHAFYSLFLQHGIEIYEYRKSFMHSKVAVIDGQWATVGSSNIDPFSLLLAREANVVVDDKKFAQELRDGVLQNIADGAQQVSQENWQKRHLLGRFASWITYGCLRLFLGVIGYADER